MPSTFPNPPTLAPCTATTPPALPVRWDAVGLLTPWESAQLIVARVAADSGLGAMRVTLFGLEYGYVDLLFAGTSAYLIHGSTIAGAGDRLFGPIATDAVVPAPGWLNGAAACQGIGNVLAVSCAWWTGSTTCQNGYQNGPPPPTPTTVANTFNFREDTGAPWRFVFVNRTNDYHLPVLGAYPIVHFPSFASVKDAGLAGLVGLIKTATPVDGDLAIATADDIEAILLGSVERMTAADIVACRTMIAKLIPGLRPGGSASDPVGADRASTGGSRLPFWPDRMFLTSYSTPTAGPAPFPTQVFYDWTIKRMLTRLWLPGGAFEDAILDASSTHLVVRKPDGTHICGKVLPVGLVKPDWAAQDDGRCRAVITDNPALSPGRTTNICVLPSRPGQVFWTWYTSDDAPVMFVEVPQACDVILLLTDYADWEASPGPFDPSLFVVPPDCLTPSPSPS